MKKNVYLKAVVGKPQSTRSYYIAGITDNLQNNIQ
jgi:hypothetical protein